MKTTYIIKNPAGLHATIAQNIVTITNKQSNDILFEYKNKKVNAKSILSILSLGIGFNEKFTIISNVNIDLSSIPQIKKELI